MEGSHPLGGRLSTTMTTESNALAQTSAYMAENRLNSALKAETLQNMYLEGITENFEKIGDDHFGQTTTSES